MVDNMRAKRHVVQAQPTIDALFHAYIKSGREEGHTKLGNVKTKTGLLRLQAHQPMPFGRVLLLSFS